MSGNHVDLSRCFLEFVLDVLGQEMPSDFDWEFAKEMVASDPSIQEFLVTNELGGLI